ncbi:hypothetical protein M233_07185 [Xylella fastidiosa subsp. multiplex Griffin-1]|nr:hypothetical protein P303_01045 [Xylella fastidiosa MUL0034]ERI59906.1 hypothetical protein M233_07185 [Xylella fastidiosa subsp. multiplex Griffin-1]
MSVCLDLKGRLMHVSMEHLSDTSVPIRSLLVFMPIILKLLIRASNFMRAYGVN